MCDMIVLGETLMLIGQSNPQRAQELFEMAGGEIRETKENGVRYIIIKDKTEKNDNETN